MLRTAETEKLGQAGRQIGRACHCAFFSITLFLTGCSNGGLLHGSKNHKTDPLFGDPASKDNDKGGGPPRTSSNVPAIPPATASSNVALAMATPLPGARPLSIGENVNEPVPARPATTLTSTNTTPGNALSRPQPVVVPLPRETPDVQPALMTVPASQSNEYFLSQLRARGVTWHRADSVPGGIRFSCIVPNRQNPTITRTFEATAPDFPAAVNAVLQQIDRNN